jgi:SNF family Na+-dependent transporter
VVVLDTTVALMAGLIIFPAGFTLAASTRPRPAPV